MKIIALLLVISRFAQAQTTADIFKQISFTQPKCYGREYTKKDLAAHPKQTVEQIKAKLMKYSADTTIDSNGLQIEVRLKGEKGANYHAEFSCFDNDGKTLCAIDCDGGSVTIGTFDATQMTLNSNGFIVRGGCGEEGKTKFLKALKGGDDIFKLQALPASYCSNLAP